MKKLWNEITPDGPRVPESGNILVRFSSGKIRRYEEIFPPELATHWMLIPEVPTSEKKGGVE